MIVLYYVLVQDELKNALLADFRRFFHTSFYDCSISEAVDLIPALLKNSESLFYAEWHKTEAISMEARLLQAVQNAVIASIPTKKGQEYKKKDALVKLPVPKAHVFFEQNVENSKKRFAEKGWGRLADIWETKNSQFRD